MVSFQAPLQEWGYFSMSILLYSIWLTYTTITSTLARGRNPPPPRQVPSWLPFGLDIAVVGVYKLLAHEFFDWSRHLMNTYGRTVQLQMLGTRLLVTDDAENIKAIMQTQFRDYVKGELLHKMFSTSLGESVFAADGQAWHTARNQLRSHLQKSRPSDLEITEKHFQRLLSLLVRENSSNVFDVFDRYQLDVVCDVFMGQSADSLLSGDQPIRKAMSTLLEVNGYRLLLGKAGLYLPDTLLVPKAVKTLDKYLGLWADKELALPISELEKKSENKRNLLEHMALLRLPRKTLQDQSMAVVLGAKDPSTVHTTWAIYELARHPEILADLRHEILSSVGTAPPTKDQIKSLPLLRRVVLETFRVHHALGLNLRYAAKDTTLPHGGGVDGREPIQVKRGTQIMFSILSLQRREEVSGPEPDEWRPERWESWEPGLWDFIPFNNGPRVCLGRAFGQLQVEYAVARIAQEFSAIKILSGEKQKIKMELNTKMAYPVICSFTRA